MGSTNETQVILTLLAFLAFLTFISNLPDTPPEYKIISPFDFVWFTGGIIGVAASCSVWTGIPCAAALAVFGLVSFFNYLVVNYEVVKLLIFMPVIATLIYVVARLGRGGG
jgi:hypothetical protein